MQAWCEFMRKYHERPGLPLAVLDEDEVTTLVPDDEGDAPA